MSWFLTRVELHGATSSHYETLHSKMKEAGFRQTITGDNGQVFTLPTAEYYCESPLESAGVVEVAKGCANATGKTSTIISVRFNQAAWS